MIINLKHIVLAIGMTIVTALAGCANLNTAQGQASINQAVSYGLMTAQIAQALINAKLEVSQSETAVISHQADYSAQQWAQLAYSDKQINQAVDLIDNLSRGPGGAGTAVLVNMAELTQVYASTKAAYLSARAIIQPTLGKYTPEQQAALTQLDASAQALDQGASMLANAAPGTNITPLLISALQVAALAAKVALAAGA